jgi:hypothetical protein
LKTSNFGSWVGNGFKNFSIGGMGSLFAGHIPLNIKFNAEGWSYSSEPRRKTYSIDDGRFSNID